MKMYAEAKNIEINRNKKRNHYSLYGLYSLNIAALILLYHECRYLPLSLLGVFAELIFSGRIHDASLVDILCSCWIRFRCYLVCNSNIEERVNKTFINDVSKCSPVGSSTSAARVIVHFSLSFVLIVQL